MGVSLGQTSGPDLLRGEKFFKATNDDGVEIGHAVGSEPTLAFTPLASSRPVASPQNIPGRVGVLAHRLRWWVSTKNAHQLFFSARLRRHNRVW